MDVEPDQSGSAGIVPRGQWDLSLSGGARDGFRTDSAGAQEKFAHADFRRRVLFVSFVLDPSLSLELPALAGQTDYYRSALPLHSHRFHG